MTDNTMARHDITEILLKVALNTNKQTNQMKKDKQRSTKHYTQKPKIEQHEPHSKPGVNSGAPEG